MKNLIQIYIKFVIAISLAFVSSCSKAPLKLINYKDSSQGLFKSGLKRHVLSYNNVSRFENKLYVMNRFNELKIFNLEKNKIEQKIKLDEKTIVRPWVEQNIVYYYTSKGNLVALDLQSKKNIWTSKLLYSGIGALLANDTHIFATSVQSKVFAVSKKDGSITWTYSKDFVQSNLPGDLTAKAIIDGEEGIFPLSDASVIKLNLNTGQLLDELNISNDRRPLVNNQLYNKYWYYAYANDIAKLSSTQDGRFIWGSDDQGSYAEAIFKGEYVYIALYNGDVERISLQSGLSEWSSKGFGIPINMQIFADKYLVMGTSRGELHVINIENGKRLWTYNMKRSFVGPLFVYKNQITAVTQEGAIYTFEPKLKL